MTTDSTPDRPTSVAPAAPRPVRRTERAARQEPIKNVTYCGHTKLIFLWPLIAYGLIAPLFERWGTPLETLGWVNIFITLFVLLAIAVDLSRNYGIFWLVVIALILVLGRWLADVKNITVLGDLHRWFADLEVRYDSGTGLALSVILAVFFVFGVIWSWMNNRYTMSHNEVVHHVWGRGDRSVGRGARVITIVYPDWFEFILCLAGTIIVYDNTGRTQICRSENVPLLLWRSRKIDKILESISVTAEEAAASEVSDQVGTDSSADDLH